MINEHEHKYYPNSRTLSEVCLVCGFKPFRLTNKQFKQAVLDWLAENKIFPKKVRVYKSRQYGLDVRVYTSTMEIPNNRKSFRERKEERDGQRHGSYGIHSRTISLYTAISEQDWQNPKEKKFILDVLKGTL